MNLKHLTILGIFTLTGCSGGVYVADRPYHRRAVVIEPAPVEVRPVPVVVAPPPPGVPPQPTPTIIEEGSVVNGVVVVAPAQIDDYVFINNGWYYWHPQFHVWVRAHRPEGWRPPERAHVYQNWNEHPMYRRR